MTWQDMSYLAMCAVGLAIAVTLPPVMWQWFCKLREERAGYQEALDQNRRSEILYRTERRYSIRSYQRREREERERDEKGYE